MPSTEMREGELERCSSRRGASASHRALAREAAASTEAPCAAGTSTVVSRQSRVNCCQVAQDGQQGLSSAWGREGRRHKHWDGYRALGLAPSELWGEGSLSAGTGDAALGQPWLIQPWCWVSQERRGSQWDPCNIPRPPSAAQLPWLRQSSPHQMPSGEGLSGTLCPTLCLLVCPPWASLAPSHPLSRCLPSLLPCPPRSPGQEGWEGARLSPLSSSAARRGDGTKPKWAPAAVGQSSPSPSIQHHTRGVGTTCITHHDPLPATLSPGPQCSVRAASPPRALPGAVLGWPLPSSHPPSCRIRPSRELQQPRAAATWVSAGSCAVAPQWL